MASFPNSVIVTADPAQSQRGVLRYDERVFKCVLGRSGISSDKHEGDGATPAGIFPLRRVVYRGDRLNLPATSLPASAIASSDGWCDDPTDKAYNRPVKLPYPASAEAMWREDHVYDVVVVVGHNDDPVLPKAGSAIFMHVAAPDGSPTAGCVALAQEDLLWLLQALRPNAQLEIRG